MVKFGQEQKGMQKDTSIQQWNKLFDETFHKSLRIEERKDRESIYSLIREFGFPHERFHAFKTADELSREQFLETLGDLGLPYWISASPKIGVKDLGRMSKLNIDSADEGWDFIKSLPRPQDYKIIIMQYPTEMGFKGTALVSKSLNGIADFVLGDQHVKLTAGLTLPDPMLFSSQEIYRYSTVVNKEYQDLLYSYVSQKQGHYEFQWGLLNKEMGLSFFDYNDELAYEDIDSLFQDLLVYFQNSSEENAGLLIGLPASLGRAKGHCRIVLSGDLDSVKSIREGDVLVTDATRPEMVPVMKKVSAIITDLGGVTCHAAIVCRELKIPCIVGTKRATTSLKDGQLLEVDAFKGTIKVIG